MSQCSGCRRLTVRLTPEPDLGGKFAPPDSDEAADLIEPETHRLWSPRSPRLPPTDSYKVRTMSDYIVIGAGLVTNGGTLKS